MKIEKELAKEMKDLAKEMRRLKKLDFMRVFAKPWKFMLFALVKGLMVGLGTVLGATILVAVVIYILSKMGEVPLIGDFVESIVEQVETQVDLNGNG